VRPVSNLLFLSARPFANLSRHIIDPELGHVFEFYAQKTNSPSGFPDMKIIFDILYDDEVFHIKAIKTADLDSTDLDRAGSLEQEWQALHDPRPEAKHKLEFEPMKDEDFWPLRSGRKRMFPENRKRKAECGTPTNLTRKALRRNCADGLQVSPIQQRFVQPQVLCSDCTDYVSQVLGRPQTNRFAHLPTLQVLRRPRRSVGQSLVCTD
jgi:hypothetical protein